jgi:hypothetical protein
VPSIFVSYRRSDAPAHAGRLYDRFLQRFGAANVFMDVGSLEPGVDFVDVLEQTLARCDVLVAVIGRDWLLTERLDDPRDWVRLEIATALKRDIRVIPVLVEGAHMPSAASLPDELAALGRRQAVELSESGWGAQVGQLLDALAGLDVDPAPHEVGGLSVRGSIIGSTTVIGDHNTVNVDQRSQHPNRP